MRTAEHLFAQKGFACTDMRSIAQAAQVSIGAIYHHFSSKDELFVAILRQEFDRWKKALTTLLDQKLPMEEIIPRMIQVHFSMAREHAAAVRLFHQSLLSGNPKLSKTIESLRQEGVDYLAAIIRNGIESGKIRPCNPKIAAHGLIGMLAEVTARAMDRDAIGREFMAQGPDELANLAWRALRAEGGT